MTCAAPRIGSAARRSRSSGRPTASNARLLINGNPHAVFDFAAQRGYARARMPRTFQQKRGIWPSTDHAWSDDAVAWLGLRKSA